MLDEEFDLVEYVLRVVALLHDLEQAQALQRSVEVRERAVLEAVHGLGHAAYRRFVELEYDVKVEKAKREDVEAMYREAPSKAATQFS